MTAADSDALVAELLAQSSEPRPRQVARYVVLEAGHQQLVLEAVSGAGRADIIHWLVRGHEGLVAALDDAQRAALDSRSDPTTVDYVHRMLSRQVDEHDAVLLSQLHNWSDFWAADRRAEDWLAAPFIPRGRAVAVYARPKQGKSLLLLDVAAGLAAHGGAFGRCQGPPVHVLYLDFEMGVDDLDERLGDMGYGPHSDLSHLHYATLPTLPPLDTAEGGQAVARLAELVHADLVVVDTLGRAVEGEENSNDTIRSFYRHTGLVLKAAGRTVVRSDHAGKDAERGQRGASAKNDDVDLVWQLARTDDGCQLRCTHRRVSWVPERIDLQLVSDPLAYKLVTGRGYVAGTKEIVELLDRLDVPIGASRVKTRQALNGAGETVRNAVLGDAMRFRRERLTDVLEGGDRPRGPVSGPMSGTDGD